MPKKRKREMPEEQSARFQAEVEKLVAAGELSLTEAEESLDKLIRSGRVKQIGSIADV